LTSRTVNNLSSINALCADDQTNYSPSQSSPHLNLQPLAHDVTKTSPPPSPYRSPRYGDSSDVISVSSATSGISEASCATRASTMNNSEMIPNAWIHAGKRSTKQPKLQDEDTPLLPTDGMVSVLFAGKTKKGITPSNPEKPNQGNHRRSYPPSHYPSSHLLALLFLSYSLPLNFSLPHTLSLTLVLYCTLSRRCILHET